MKRSAHQKRLLVIGGAIATVLTATLAYGLDYYWLELPNRVISSKHLQLRPSGSIGVKLGMLGAALLCCLYAYPVRKRWKWLQRFGKTKNWLDFHVLFGISVPLLITFHSSFKLQGLAGVAYWIMLCVMLSGFAGRYLYAQIPRRLNAATMTFDELAELCSATMRDIEQQRIFSAGDVQQVLRAPDSTQIEEMSVARAVLAMVWMDVLRPFRVASLRRRSSSSTWETVRTAGGLFSSSNAELEEAIRLVRKQSRLVAKMAFLGRANQIFQLWHVVHRPFSCSFLVLALIHITLVLLLGYY